MLRKFFALAGLTFAGFALGCAMCQDCLDETGPVPESPNYHSFEHTPRAGSVSSGAVVEGSVMEGPAVEGAIMEGAAIEGPVMEMGTEFSE